MYKKRVRRYFDGIKTSLCPAEICWDDEQILSIEFLDENAENIEEGILIPRLVNAHAHLELTHLKGKLTREQSFPTWVSELRTHTQNWALEDYHSGVISGLNESKKQGIGWVVDTTNQAFIDAQKHKALLSEIHYIPCLEVMGLDPSLACQKMESYRSLFQESSQNHRSEMAIHAPYSCSKELMSQVLNEQSQHHSTQIHMAESQAEHDLFVQNQGDFTGFLKWIYPDYDFGLWTDGAFEYFQSLNFLYRFRLVHANFLTITQLEKVAEQKQSIVICPQSRRFFGHRAFLLKEAIDLGINVAIGTDSLASADSLNIWKDLALLCSEENIDAEFALQMATLNGHRSLGQDHQFGRIDVGFKPDFYWVEGVANVAEAIGVMARM